MLRLVCLSLPRSSVNLIRSQDLLQYIQEWNGSVDPDEVTTVILHVGDIANCHDDLNHNDCLDGVAWALSKMPQWHRPSIAQPTDQDEQLIGTLWTDSAGKISLLAQTSQVKEPGLSLALHRYSVYVSSIFATPYSA